MFTILGGDGKEYGPVSLDQLREWMAQNRANLDTQARREHGPWLPLRAHPEFAALAGPGSARFESVLPPSSPALPAFAAVVTPAPELSSPSSPPPPPDAKVEEIKFTGEWTEYLKIWIVNVLLTVATLGIYAAWAKVRKRRYFYAHTRVCGHAFEYLASPVKILIGNVAVVALLFALYVGSQAISPLFYFCAAIVLVVLTPWLIVRACAFDARNTAWRGRRFVFRGRGRGAAAAFLGWPLLLGCTLGLLYPFVLQKQKEFLVRNHAYGAARFQLRLELGELFKAFAIAALFFLPLIGAYFMFFILGVAAAIRSEDGGPQILGALFGFLLIAGVPCAMVGAHFWRARMFNLVWNGTSIGGHRFVARMRAREFILLQLINAVVTLLTLGLLHPWAVVRKMRYQLDCLSVLPGGDLDACGAEAQPAGSTIGGAAGELFDFDLGFGV